MTTAPEGFRTLSDLLIRYGEVHCCMPSPHRLDAFVWLFSDEALFTKTRRASVTSTKGRGVRSCSVMANRRVRPVAGSSSVESGSSLMPRYEM